MEDKERGEECLCNLGFVASKMRAGEEERRDEEVRRRVRGFEESGDESEDDEAEVLE